MPKFTLSQIDNLIDNPIPFIELNYGDLQLKIKLSLADYEEKVFIDTICSQSFDGFNYSPTLRKAITEVLFAKLFIVNDDDNGVDIPDAIDDLYSAFETLKKLNLVARAIKQSAEFDDYYYALSCQVDDKIEYEKQKNIAYLAQSSATTEAVENVNELLSKIMKLLDTADELLSINGKKLSKTLTPSKIEKFMKSFQEKGLEMIFNKID